MARRPPRLPAPFLRRVAFLPDAGMDRSTYPFTLPFLRDPDWEMTFDQPVTIIVGENGTGKSTLIEGLAELAGYDQAGGGKGYRPVRHDRALENSGADLASVWRASWLPKVTDGWFFRAESFFSVARYLDETAQDGGGAPPDFLSHSHGEGFLRVFAERCSRPGLYLMDEPESALSPQRQLDLLAILARVQQSATAQVILATHSPILMALPGARLLQLTRFGLDPVDLRQTRHFLTLAAFCRDPEGFVAEALADRAQDPAMD
ncbi:AAA family ATPase [Gemmobacter denitrificans]|uniref:AAA family ATPase n=1 Tax=Gemmobacter denitrificans TaxID=3123040 RepID=A0ABU8BUQ6_9RHOB